MEWTYLLIAGLLEVVWGLGLKYAEGFTKIFPTIVTIIATIFSFWFLSLSLKTLPLGTAYAIWTGIGTVGTIICGVLFFNEPISLMKAISFFLIVLGMAGLKFF